ncbi:PstS family phosphate ABC transporter substrate-binding protein [Fusibacter tunisiensis]|uniref:Phosphate transport system substrate-binding protein n=1 Tax=Fusibacter tunisiensis TaxID=1008308 RepID=A0ABS2MNA7_9FIRM|nr:substrate-binding domain-containing protein [Fusibacter tunisiensis]MBM7560807.1 phosphate transport system substrate-binding protein [Fusibacter tunisiensis]
MKKNVLFFIVILLSVSCIGCDAQKPNIPLESYVKVDGSTVTIPLSEMLAAAITGESLETVRPHILHNKTHNAYVNLIDGKADLIFVTSPSEEELAYAKEQDVSLVITPIVSEAFVFLTHTDNPVDNLSFEELQKIYTGEITNWSEVGGPNLKIAAYQRPVNSGSQTGFLDLVMQDKTPATPPMEHIHAGMGDLIDAVASYENQPDAIGYSYYYFVVDMWGNTSVKLLKIDTVYPDKKTIASGDYPITTSYYAVYRENTPKSSPIYEIVDWLLTEEGQDLMEAAGYVQLD